jgi:nitrite reductase/ring-hydroxylating ferredoxin subunit
MPEPWSELAFAPQPETDVCALDDIEDGKGRAFVFGEGKDAFGLLVLRAGERVFGYVNRCPHFGIPLTVSPVATTFREHVLCANHYAAFRFDDGYCVEGPCERASLISVPLELSQERIRVRDTRSRRSGGV